MDNMSSGSYTIDSEYTIVSFNKTAAAMFPQIARGEKCHVCLMGKDEPCASCPVLNEVKGPHVYFDPIRKKQETVNAVETETPDGRPGHALVFTAVGPHERFANLFSKDGLASDGLYDGELTDDLTGGPNRAGFIRMTESLLKGEDPTSFAVLFFNIKNFKAINEAFGIVGGDELLIHLYNRMTDSELAPLVVARLEADHFAWLIRSKNLDLALLNRRLESEWSMSGKDIQLHLRCGVYYLENGATPVVSMIDRANRARQQTEGERINRVGVFDPKEYLNYVDEADILAEFQRGIDNHEFKVYYQPVVDVSSGRVVSAEALVRWASPQRGMVSPGVFVPVLEKNGYISKLDAYVLDTVARTMDRREREGKQIVPVSVNLSWLDFYDEDLLKGLTAHLERIASRNVRINLELTETSFTALEQNRSSLLSTFRRLGTKLLLDDFGSGFSTFAMIRDYDFNVLKIDMSFIRQIESNAKVRNIIVAIIEMCHQIGLAVVAEGVENEGELRFLRNAGCNYIQGFFYSAPLSEEDFFAYLAEHEGDAAPLQDHDDFTEFLSSIDDHKMVEYLSGLLDGTGQYIHVCDPTTHRMVYANEVTRHMSGHPDEPYVGKTCHQYMVGLDAPCPHCPVHQPDSIGRQLEVDDGTHVYSYSTRFVDWDGRRLVAEFGRDITGVRRNRQRFDTQIAMIIDAVPKDQGAFHVDLTDDVLISVHGTAKGIQNLSDAADTDTIARTIASTVPTEEGQSLLLDTFRRISLLRAWNEGRHEVTLDTEMRHGDGTTFPVRVTARMLQNPETLGIECIAYCVSIPQEHKEVQQLESDLGKVRSQFLEADRNRRTDFLTGLKNRLDLFDCLRDAVAGDSPSITMMFMLDIDDFKAINDEYGHSAGDEVLRSIGQALYAYGQENNIVFFRYGGEEFLGVGSGPAIKAEKIADDLLQIIRGLKVRYRDAIEIGLTASLGYTTNNHRFEKMVDHADQAMYIAKRRGKNRAVCSEAFEDE